MIAVPTVTLEGDANGAPQPTAVPTPRSFPAKCAHRLLKDGVGHNLPQEAPQAFAGAVIEGDGY